ncbi:MAG: dicarboxylate/amino acid:cation symporter [Candidatus Protochlamydia sp.]|nr:dicarboxylate/amino acid:cation symporter [Candidatus Protochlamydia sp.]
MCTHVKRKINPNLFFAIAVLLGVCTGYYLLDSFIVMKTAETVSQVFINLLKLVSLPIIFLSIVSTASGMENLQEIKQLGQKVVKYTLLTTVIAATVALVLFIAIDPVRGQLAPDVGSQETAPQTSYLSFFIQIVPSNIVQPFSENNVIGVLFLALLLSFAVVSLPSQHRTVLHSFFSSIYAAIIAITRWIVAAMPIAIWAFITLFMRDLKQGLDIKSLALYLTVVVAANLIQAFGVLPLLLKIKKISPYKMVKGMYPALSVAFFTKSSAAALPTAMQCAEENIGISRKVASFSLPLCTTINMNACAAFILTTVLFVSMSQGMTYTLPEMGLWIILATIAAIGNAGVPMGCYFLASAFLAAMNVPLNILGVILPFYTMIDMLESAINVWSDSCVTAVVDQEVKQEALASSHTHSVLT